MVNKWTEVVRKGLKGDSLVVLPSYIKSNLIEYGEESVKIMGKKSK
jgi:hypothetical protein